MNIVSSNLQRKKEIHIQNTDRWDLMQCVWSLHRTEAYVGIDWGMKRTEEAQSYCTDYETTINNTGGNRRQDWKTKGCVEDQTDHKEF